MKGMPGDCEMKKIQNGEVRLGLLCSSTLSTLKKWNIYLCFFSKETFYFIDQRYTLLVLEEKSSTVN